jgi:hypothetical protein
MSERHPIEPERLKELLDDYTGSGNANVYLGLDPPSINRDYWLSLDAIDESTYSLEFIMSRNEERLLHIVGTVSRDEPFVLIAEDSVDQEPVDLDSAKSRDVAIELIDKFSQAAYTEHDVVANRLNYGLELLLGEIVHVEPL